MKINKRLFAKFSDAFYKVITFLIGSSQDSSKRKILRYSTYLLIVIAANFLLGKNIGNIRYSWYANVSIFLLLNINIILVLVLFIVLFRNIAKLMADRKQKIFGARLQTKLVIFSVILVVFPVFITYLMSTQFINNTIDRWFDNNVLRTVNEAVDMADQYRDSEVLTLLNQSINISKSLNWMTEEDLKKPDKIEFATKSYVENELLNGLALYSYDGVIYSQQNVSGSIFSFVDNKVLNRVLRGEEQSNAIFNIGNPCFWSGVPVKDASGKIIAALFLVKHADKSIVKSSIELNTAYQLFKQLRFYSHPVRKAFNVSNFLIALLIIFASIWGSMIFVRSIAEPLKSLAKAATNISKGRFDITVDVAGNDEITYLSRSFNYMTAKLNQHTLELQNKNRELNDALEQISKDKLYIDTIYKNVDSALFLFDTKFNVLQANDIAQELLEKSPKNVQDRALAVFIEFISSSEEEKIIQSDITIDSESRSYTAHLSKIFNSFGDLENVILVLDDNTHVMNLQRITLWKEIATRITHEIKNPLTPIKLTAERVKRRSKEISEQTVRELVENSMKTIMTEVEELINLVDEFNIFARMPSIIRADVHLKPLVLEVADLQKRGHTNITFDIDMDSDIIIKADKYQLKRVFVNLIKNAVQAIKNNEGNISINAYTDRSSVHIFLEDNGQGINEEDLPNIFVPYFSKKPDGTGLGLAIIKKIIEEHGGTIDVESKAGVFTRFHIKLPYELNLD